MNRQVSPFASLSGADKQIRWLEYQSISLPYVQADPEPVPPPTDRCKETAKQTDEKPEPVLDRPQPPPEIPRTMADFQKTRHSQYDAVIARLKQAELQSRYYASQPSQQGK